MIDYEDDSTHFELLNDRGDDADRRIVAAIEEQGLTSDYRWDLQRQCIDLAMHSRYRDFRYTRTIILSPVEELTGDEAAILLLTEDDVVDEECVITFC